MAWARVVFVPDWRLLTIGIEIEDLLWLITHCVTFLDWNGKRRDSDVCPGVIDFFY